MVRWKMTPFAYIKNNRLSGIHFPLEKMIKNHPNHKGLITSPFISSSPHTLQVQWPKDERSLKVMGGKQRQNLETGGLRGWITFNKNANPCNLQPASEWKISIMKDPRSSFTYKQGEHNCHNFPLHRDERIQTIYKAEIWMSITWSFLGHQLLVSAVATSLGPNPLIEPRKRGRP